MRAVAFEKLIQRLGFGRILIAGFLICLCGFVVTARGRARQLRAGIAIAHLTEGEARRKRVSGADFTDVVPEAPLFHRDVLWVPAGKSATVEFVDGVRIRIAENSYVVLNRSTVNHERNGKVELLSGKVEVIHNSWTGLASHFELEANGSLFKLQRIPNYFSISTREEKHAVEPAPSPLPRPSPSPEASATARASPGPEPTAPLPEFAPEAKASASPAAPPAQSSIAPRDGTLFYKIHGMEMTVSFAWKLPFTGALEIREEGSAEISSVRLENATHATRELAVEHRYSWRLAGSGADSPFPPRTFEILSASKHPFGALAQKPSGTIEVVP